MIHSARGGDEVLSFDRNNSTALPVVLYWFSPECGWCEANFANFQALAAQSAGKYRLIPVSSASLGDLGSYERRHGLRIPLYHVSADSSRQYRFRGTPETVLLSAKGSLVKRWNGAYSPHTLADVESALGVNLPGMAVVAGAGT